MLFLQQSYHEIKVFSSFQRGWILTPLKLRCLHRQLVSCGSSILNRERKASPGTNSEQRPSMSLCRNNFFKKWRKHKRSTRETDWGLVVHTGTQRNNKNPHYIILSLKAGRVQWTRIPIRLDYCLLIFFEGSWSQQFWMMATGNRFHGYFDEKQRSYPPSIETIMFI